MRHFNKSGPCAPERDYMLPPEPRLPHARELVERGKYFVVHAPRQTGKTTTLTALARDITAGGSQAALLFSCERARVYTSDIGAVGRAVLQAITEAAENRNFRRSACPRRGRTPRRSHCSLRAYGRGHGRARVRWCCSLTSSTR